MIKFYFCIYIYKTNSLKNKFRILNVLKRTKQKKLNKKNFNVLNDNVVKYLLTFKIFNKIVVLRDNKTKYFINKF